MPICVCVGACLCAAAATAAIIASITLAPPSKTCFYETEKSITNDRQPGYS